MTRLPETSPTRWELIFVVSLKSRWFGRADRIFRVSPAPPGAELRLFDRAPSFGGIGGG